MGEESRSYLRTLVKGSGIVFFGTVLEMAISFGAKLLIARVLDRTNYGAVAIGVTTIGVLSTLALLALSTGVGRYFPRFDTVDRKRGVIRSAFEIAVPLSVGVAVLLFLTAPAIATAVFDDPTVGPVLQVAALGVPFAVVFRLSIGGVQGAKKSLPKVVMENISLPVTRLLTVVVVLSLGFGAVGVTFAYALAYVSAGVLGLYYLHRHTPLFSDVPATRMHRELLTFSAPLVVSSIMARVLTDADTFLLGYFTTTGDVGDYNVVYPMALLLLSVLMSFSYLVLPILAEFHSEDRLEDMRRPCRDGSGACGSPWWCGVAHHREGGPPG